ncbi:DUF99 family protein [Natrialbaceae archaeon A-CW1-1]
MNVQRGTRALGVAESYRPDADHSTLAGAVVRADRVLDGAAFDRCTVGGLDATERICSLVASLERPDVRVLFVGAVAPAWYNLLDLEELADRTGLPVLAVTFEASEGLEDGLREAFSGAELETRLERYAALPRRHPVDLDDKAGKDDGPTENETVYVRAVGLEPEVAASVVRAFTPEGGRPEPIRVARVLARASDVSGTIDANPS